MAASRSNARARRQPRELRAHARGALPVLKRLLHTFLTLVAMGLLVFVVGAGVEATRGLAVERIVVTGKLEHLRREAVRDALSKDLDAGLVFISLQELKHKLESLPWVYRAELRRRFPDTLEVHVIEQLPIARWGNDGFLNHEARITEVSDVERWQDLPQIRGPEGSEARLMHHYQRLLGQLSPLSLTPVALHEDQFGQLQVRLDNGLELQLGDRDFSLRVQRFQQLWLQELSALRGSVIRVDMRYDGGAAVAFADSAQLAGVAADSRG